MDSITIAFLISTFPGMLMALSNWANPDMDLWHRILTGAFTVLWLATFTVYIQTYRGVT